MGGGYHAQLVALCEPAGFLPSGWCRKLRRFTLLGLVACGFGVALVPASFVVLTCARARAVLPDPADR
ncbi:hypothetical protein [Pseudomonas peli]|uniref:hypothetical protein n=1 Tax=Pseudomonas peli TaxID=592361 RepID=UPI003D15E938